MATGTDSVDLSWEKIENEESFAPYQQPRTEERFETEAGFPDELEAESEFAPYQQPRTEERFETEGDELEAESEFAPYQPRTEERFATEAGFHELEAESDSSIIPAANNAIVSTSLKPTVAGLTFQVDIYDMITATISAHEVYYCRNIFLLPMMVLQTYFDEDTYLIEGTEPEAKIRGALVPG